MSASFYFWNSIKSIGIAR